VDLRATEFQMGGLRAVAPTNHPSYGCRLQPFNKPLMTLNKTESSIDIAVASSYDILKLAIRG
jgi:hypothetical protein